jgi:hypothetical protein
MTAPGLVSGIGLTLKICFRSGSPRKSAGGKRTVPVSAGETKPVDYLKRTNGQTQILLQHVGLAHDGLVFGQTIHPKPKK